MKRGYLFVSIFLILFSISCDNPTDDSSGNSGSGGVTLVSEPDAQLIDDSRASGVYKGYFIYNGQTGTFKLEINNPWVEEPSVLEDDQVTQNPAGVPEGQSRAELSVTLNGETESATELVVDSDNFDIYYSAVVDGKTVSLHLTTGYATVTHYMYYTYLSEYPYDEYYLDIEAYVDGQSVTARGFKEYSNSLVIIWEGPVITGDQDSGYESDRIVIVKDRGFFTGFAGFDEIYGYDDSWDRWEEGFITGESNYSISVDLAFGEEFLGIEPDYHEYSGSADGSSLTGNWKHVTGKETVENEEGGFETIEIIDTSGTWTAERIR